MSVEAVNRIVGDVLSRQAIASTASLTAPDFSSKLRLSTILSQKNLHSSHVQAGPTESAVVYKKVIHLRLILLFTCLIRM
ncbi:unnamed protein product [Trichobilharzia regenti]|nr:unnamed protein product [Trichobilharzia regenti]